MTAIPGRYLSFDTVAEEYDLTRHIPAEIVDDVARFCASSARLQSGGLFLDAGVGTGRFGSALARQNPGQIVGADISLPMMEQARRKASPGGLMLVNSDLQRLPFRPGAFHGVLMVHILHLIEQWRLVLAEARRVLLPRQGVLLLGSEQGGHSAIVDRYYDRARGMGVLRASLGAPGIPHLLKFLRRPEAGGARIETLSAPFLEWKRRVTVGQTLDALRRRTYSQMWTVPEETHRALLAEAEDYAQRTFGDLEAEEIFPARFALHVVRWP